MCGSSRRMNFAHPSTSSLSSDRSPSTKSVSLAPFFLSCGGMEEVISLVRVNAMTGTCICARKRWRAKEFVTLAL